MTTETTVEQAAAREKLEQHWLGKCRYFQKVDGQEVQVPEYMFTEWFTPEDVRREVCIEVTDDGKLKWMNKPDGPPPREAFNAEDRGKSQWELNPTAAQPNFDYVPPAYNSDTHSGGPSNFDGNAGGDNSPRDPSVEGEVPNQYEKEVAAYKAQLADMEERFRKMEERLAEPAPKKTSKKTASKKTPASTDAGVDALKAAINNGQSQ